MMCHRRIGITDIYVTPIGLGGSALAWECNVEQVIELVHHALSRGINLIDTSPHYGDSQHRIGLALEHYLKGGGKRQDIVLCTKAGRRRDDSDYSADAIHRSVDNSLKLLKTEYLDVVHVHDPVMIGPLLESGGAFEALHQLKEQGVIRAVGLGMRDHAMLRRCIEAGVVDVVITYRDHNLLCQTAQDGVIEPAAARGVGVFNAMVVVGGLLGGLQPNAIQKQLLGRWADGEDIRRAQALWQWANDRHIDLLTLSLQFCLHQPHVTSTLLGMSSPQQIDTNLAAIAEPIDESVWRDLESDFAIIGGP